MTHQVFISYRHCDSAIAHQMRTVLESNGMTCWMDEREIKPSTNWDDEIMRAIPKNKLFLLLISKGSIVSPKQQKREVNIAEKYAVNILPVLVVPPESCSVFDYHLLATQYIDASQPPLLDRLEEVAAKVRQVLSTLELAKMKSEAKMNSQTAAPPKADTAPPLSPPPYSMPAASTAGGSNSSRGLAVAMLYKRDIPEDERLLGLLKERLEARGHVVFVDKQLNVGTEWRRSIREKVEKADAVIPLLSLFSVGSEMLEEEVMIAARHQHADGGRPRILPIRVNYEGALPTRLGQHLQRLQYVLWRTPEDDEKVVASMIEALEKPAAEPATVAQQREMPVGAVPLTSPFYVVRNADRIFQTGIERCDSIVLVKGARQMGKTSLIARGLQIAREKQRRVAITDLQTFNESDFHDLRSFYTALADHLADQLDIDVSLAARWDDRKAANVNFERFIRRDVLSAAEAPLAWAMDEVDRLFPCSFGTEVFGLFRSWHNARALDPSSSWGRLSLVIGFATEASLFIRDVNMSPFNVGTLVALSDFNFEEINELNARYGGPLTGDVDVRRLTERVGGQPFLVRRSLYALTVEEVPLEKLLEEAATDHGIFGDHLRRFCVSLHRDPELESATREFILRGKALTIEQFHRLRSAGLVIGEARQDAMLRCGIYHDYLKKHLE